MGLTKQDPGCCCSSTCTAVVCVISPCTDFGTQFATGVLIQIFSGMTLIGSCTTVSNSNCCTFNIPSTGTYTIKTSGNVR